MYFDLLQTPPILREFVFEMDRLQSLERPLDHAEARIYLGKLFLADGDNSLADFLVRCLSCEQREQVLPGDVVRRIGGHGVAALAVLELEAVQQELEELRPAFFLVLASQDARLLALALRWLLRLFAARGLVRALLNPGVILGGKFPFAIFALLKKNEASKYNMAPGGSQHS